MHHSQAFSLGLDPFRMAYIDPDSGKHHHPGNAMSHAAGRTPQPAANWPYCLVSLFCCVSCSCDEGDPDPGIVCLPASVVIELPQFSRDLPAWNDRRHRHIVSVR